MQQENISILIEELLSDSKVTDQDLYQKIKTLKKLLVKESRHHQEIVRVGKKQNTILTKKSTELNVLTNQLEARVAKETKMRLEKEQIIERQSKMAAMGEMMDAVAHQWKQPLNALSMYADLLQMDFKEGNVNASYIDELVEDF
ncbi:MAG: hypothetical protein DRG24_04980, partial [Epsilonproteobacteria bacterium]